MSGLNSVDSFDPSSSWQGLTLTDKAANQINKLLEKTNLYVACDSQLSLQVVRATRMYCPPWMKSSLTILYMSI